MMATPDALALATFGDPEPEYEPAPPMSDRDVIREIERRLTELDRITRRCFDDDPDGDGIPRPWEPDDILDPLNAILVFLEEVRP